MLFSMASMKAGEKGYITHMIGGSPLARRLIDIGFATGTVIECLGRSPLGDPIAYAVKGTVIALRKEDAAYIFVRKGENVSWD